MVTKRDLQKASRKFEELEGRGSFYDIAVNLINNKFNIEAYFLILSTWNFASFRYSVKNFDIVKFKKIIKQLEIPLKKIEGKTFKKIKFENFKDEIINIFEKLSNIKGIKYTGASKLMHLMNREVFLMWDGYIRGEKAKRYYNNLDIVKNGIWKTKRYKKDGESYFQFLKETQDLFKNIDYKKNKKSFTKVIDEYLYVNITLHIQKKLKKIK